MATNEGPSFITQVKNPDEVDETPPQPATTTTTTTKEPQNKSCWSSFFCCSGTVDESEDTQKPSDNRKSTVGKIAINLNENDKYGVNSPRISGKYQPQGVAVYSDDHLLPPQNEKKKGKKCLVLDLDETLVHSSFKLVPCDFVVPVTIDEKTYKVYVAKRPHVDEFLKRCGELYEVVIFTASLAQYADPVVDLLDIHKVVDWRLFRESCTPFKGAYVKDMGRMGRDITQIMIVDNSPHSYLFNRENAIPCETWYNDQNDTELLEMIPLLEQLASPDVTDVKKTLRELEISPLDVMGPDELTTSDGSDEGTEYSSDEYSDDEA